jgi:hypothetical protein
MSALKNIDHSARKHALLSASGASRWMSCTPSAVLETQFEEKSSSYAEEGTLAHEFAELNLKLQLGMLSKRGYNKLAKPFLNNTHYTDDMEENVQIHIDYVVQQYTEAKRRTPDAILMIEEKVDLTDYIEEGYGTCDDIILADGVLEVIDLKYGKGLRVSAKDNPQLKLYALGALRSAEIMYDIHTVRLTIVQPRLDNISSWEVDADALREWGEKEVKPKAELAFQGEGEFNPGDWCLFCKAKVRCKALADQNMEVAKKEFADPELLTDEEIIENYKIFDQIQGWMRSVTDYLLSEALKGKEWPEHKLVAGRSNRVWTDPSKVEEILKENKFDPKKYLSEPKLLGIGAIEKLVGKTKFPVLLGEVVDKPLGKPSLVHESDKRPPFSVTDAKTDFAD